MSIAWNSVTVQEMPRGIATMASIAFDPFDVVGMETNTFTGQQTAYDWQAAYWQGSLSFPAMNRSNYDQWCAFILSLRGSLNPFLLGDPRAATPRGNPVGAPVVNGAGQGVFNSGVSCFQVATRGWQESASNLLLPGDYISIFPRLYRVTAAVSSDANGAATIPIWPNLRDAPADETAIATSNCQGLFRLASNQGNGFSVNVESYGLSALKIREYI